MAAHVEVALSNPPANPLHNIASSGLTGAEAHSRLQKDGPNAMPDVSAHPLRNALAKFWAPVPWLLEASIVLELVLHKNFEASISASLFPGRSRPSYLKGLELTSRLE